jgi:hypothetical protein
VEVPLNPALKEWSYWLMRHGTLFFGSMPWV